LSLEHIECLAGLPGVIERPPRKTYAKRALGGIQPPGRRQVIERLPVRCPWRISNRPSACWSGASFGERAMASSQYALAFRFGPRLASEIGEIHKPPA